MKKIVFLLTTLLTLVNCNTLDIDKNIYDALDDGIYAKVETTEGDMIVKFFDKESPVTVANFIGLAQGKIENDAKKKGEPFYDGIIFHRVIEKFMLQGGDPTGTGMGDPGYKFEDEKNNLKHESKGILSMANSGPNTNGSQFFIIHVPTPHLDGKHTVFGKVVVGEDVIDKIAMVEKGAGDKPVTDVVINKVIVFTKGSEYKNYDAAKVFNEGKSKIQESNNAYIAKQEAEAAKQLEEIKKGMQATSSGLMYKIIQQGSGKQPNAGDVVQVHYAGKLLNGQEFDNSFKRNEPIEVPIGVGNLIKGWDEGILLLKEGDKAIFLIPSELGYGERGAGGVIPPNATLIFEVELVKVK